MSPREELEQAIINLEAQRAILGDTAVDAAIQGIRTQLTALEPSTEPKRQRKHVTVLFADVSGFTAMSETMDAEDMQAMMNALWQHVDQAILDHNGRIDKHIGDAVMALWGVDQAREDDPEQAIRAALAMHTAVADFAKVRNLSLNMRIGLNTGPVLLGEVGITGEFTAMGDTVNVASRLEHAAPVGSTLISHNLYRLVRGVFDALLQDPLTVKGKSEPLQTYLIRQAKPRAFRMGTRGIEGLETRMVGREEELQQLQAAFETAVATRQMHVVTIAGAAGVGKSRLLHEFENWVELRPERIRYFKGRGSQQTQVIPHYLLRDTLATRFQILDSDPLPVVHRKFTVGLAEFMSIDEELLAMKAAVLGSWLGYDFSHHPEWQRVKEDPEQIRNRASLYLAQYFSTIQEPTVMFFEDIHWGDDSSLQTVIDLTRRESSEPCLIVCVTRPSLYERHPTWGEQLPNHTLLTLAPLSADAARDLVTEVLHLVDPLPTLLIDLINNRAEGNPFYVEELVKMMIDDGIILTDADRWQVVADKLLTLNVPATLTGVLQARLDRLPQPEKITAQQAATIGHIFWDSALTALAREETKPSLSALQTREFIYQRGESAFMDTKEYKFKHVILRDVTYETVLKHDRRQYHRLAADWLVTTAEANGRGDEYAALIGEHYQLAEKMTEAAQWYGRAGQQATVRFAHEAAVQYLSFALQFTPEEDHETLFALLSAREKAYDLQGNRPAQEEDLSRLETLSAQLGPLETAQVALRQARNRKLISDFVQAIHYAQVTVEIGQQENAIPLSIDGHVAWGEALWGQGDYASAQAQMQEGLRLAQKASLPQQVANCLNGLGVVAYNQGDYAAAITYGEKSLSIYQEVGDRKGESNSLNNLGLIAKDQAHLSASMAYHKKSLAIRQAIGDRRGEGASFNNMGIVAKRQGDYSAAIRYYEQALTILQDVGDRMGMAGSLNNLGSTALDRGDYVTTIKYFQQALKIFREVGFRLGESITLNNLGIVAKDRGDHPTARAHFEQSLAICWEIGDREGEGITLNHLGALALLMQDPSKAAWYYDQALIIRQALDQPHYIVEDWAGLAQTKLVENDAKAADQYSQQALDYIRENPALDGVENRMQVFHFLWKVLTQLGRFKDADDVLVLAAQIIQDYLDQNRNPALQEMYLAQPHHRALWHVWQKNCQKLHEF